MEEQYRRLLVKDLENNPWQPREIFPRDKLEGLADSIRGLGVIEPIVARPHPKKKGMFQLAVGAMRAEASRLAGKNDVPVVIRDLDDRQMRLYGLAENLHRADLTDIEREKAISGLWRKYYGTEDMGLQEFARDLGMSTGYAKDILDACDTRESLRAGNKVSTDVLSRVSAIAGEDKKSAKELLKARENEQITDADFRKVVPVIKSTPKEMRPAAIGEVMKAHVQARQYVSAVTDEMEARKGQPRVEIRRISSADERAVSRLADVFKDMRFYATMSFVGTVRDPKARQKAIKIIEDMENHLSRELQRIQKRKWDP